MQSEARKGQRKQSSVSEGLSERGEEEFALGLKLTTRPCTRRRKVGAGVSPIRPRCRRRPPARSLASGVITHNVSEVDLRPSLREQLADRLVAGVGRSHGWRAEALWGRGGGERAEAAGTM